MSRIWFFLFWSFGGAGGSSSSLGSIWSSGICVPLGIDNHDNSGSDNRIDGGHNNNRDGTIGHVGGCYLVG